MKPSERLQWNILRDTAVALRVEREPAVLCGDNAAPRGWRRVQERALAGVPEE